MFGLSVYLAIEKVEHIVISMLLSVINIERKWVLGSSEPGVFISHSPSKESRAHTWVIDEACS